MFLIILTFILYINTRRTKINYQHLKLKLYETIIVRVL